MASGGETSGQVSRFGTFLLGVYFIALTAFTVFILIATWPVVSPGSSGQVTNFAMFGWSPNPPFPSDVRLFISVAAAGALGSLLHALASFGDYVGNRRLVGSWVWWLLMRTPSGMALAILFYLVLRGGLVSPTMTAGTNATQDALLLNPYGLAAMGAMAGMFSKQAVDKLREVFDTLFRTADPVDRNDKLDAPANANAPPRVIAALPGALKAGSVAPLPIELQGLSFARACSVTANGVKRDVRWNDATSVTVTLKQEDVASVGVLTVLVQNSADASSKSDAFALRIVPP